MKIKKLETFSNEFVCFVKATADDGSEGWGQVAPYNADITATVLHRMVAPHALGMDAFNIDAMTELVTEKEHKYPGSYLRRALSGVDTALWDLTAKAANLPLYRLLGGQCTQDLPLYHSITCIEPDAMAEIAYTAKQTGIMQFQVKLGADNNWRTDVARLTRVREAVGDEALVYGDWNCGSSQLDASRVGRAVAHLDIMLEQPCKTIEECASVKNACQLPMKMDESACDIPSLLKAHRFGCMDAVALKLSKFGGLSAMRQARDLCIQLGAKMCIEDTWGSDITTATALHLATATPAKSLLNVCDLSGYVHPRLDENAPVRDGGVIRAADKPGHGVSPNPDVLGQPVLNLT